MPGHLAELVTNPGWSATAWREVIAALTDTDAVLSLASNGIQDVLEPARAAERAHECNDALAAVVAAHPQRYAAFAALPMQDPPAAAEELDRAIRELGFRGALVNGYSSIGDLSTARYYDDPAYDPLWARFAHHGVPLYLHPRNPQPDQRRIYAGREELLGPTWAFGAETAVHALRMLTGGVFDRVPELQVVLGHLGELLPFAIRRLEQRLARRADVTLSRAPSEYLRDYFWITTSGNYHTASLVGILLELGSDRIVFAADYPFERLRDGTDWIDAVPIPDRDRLKIARTNALGLLRLD